MGQSSDVHLGLDSAPLQTNAGRDAMELSSFWKPLAVAGVGCSLMVLPFILQELFGAVHAVPEGTQPPWGPRASTG